MHFSVTNGALKAGCCLFKRKELHCSSERGFYHSITYNFLITLLVKDKHQTPKTKRESRVWLFLCCVGVCACVLALESWPALILPRYQLDNAAGLIFGPWERRQLDLSELSSGFSGYGSHMPTLMTLPQATAHPSPHPSTNTLSL